MRTSLLAICGGYYRSGEREPYGKWVQLVCPIPQSLFEQQAFVSILYAHLSGSVEAPEYTAIERGALLGHVGKTGNAKGPKIKPHLHLEMVVHDDLVKAQAEAHPLKDSGTSEVLEEQLKARCLDLIGLRPTVGPFMYARRIDPYLLLICLADQPQTGLDGKRWSEGYGAAVDVDVERKAVLK
jgi:murein DD-endopeptidase MepM/ murein hydrolase activator NlpD